MLGPAPSTAKKPSALKAAAQEAVRAFDEWQSRSKPKALVDAMDELRDALR